jgi:ribosome-associated translation inhibitor RaiA
MSGNLAPVFAGLTLLLTAAGVYAGWILRIAKGESAAEKVKAVEVELAHVKTELSEFKVHVAATYASSGTIEQMESRLVDAINRLGDRLDRVLERRPTRG